MKIVFKSKYCLFGCVADTDEITVIYWYGERITSVWLRTGEFGVIDGVIKNLYVLPDDAFKRWDSLFNNGDAIDARNYIDQLIPQLTPLTLSDFTHKQAREFKGLGGWPVLELNSKGQPKK